jgi:hypothetical protein
MDIGTNNIFQTIFGSLFSIKIDIESTRQKIATLHNDITMAQFPRKKHYNSKL